ncbi:MAG: hypothetical protein PHI03_13075 [Bacteroidales bacterium]|nr:hypothetical protein [Bacteroidales bacterium]
MNEKNQVKPVVEILPVVYKKSKCTPKVRMIETNELINRRYIVKDGSFQITLTVKPFYKSIL